MKFFLLSILLTFVAMAAPTQIVFIHGDPSHGPGMHEYRAGCMLLARALEEQSGLAVKTTVQHGWPADEKMLDDAATIVIFDSATKVIGGHMAKLDKLADKGTGMVMLHYAVHPSPEDGARYYTPWIGGFFEGGWSVNPFWVAELTGLSGHPVGNGVAFPVKVHDEYYYNMRFLPLATGRRLELVTAVPQKENLIRINNLWTDAGIAGIGKPQALMWGIERANGGRGVGYTGGHFHRNWAIDGVRTMVLNAIAWTAGLPVPASGIRSYPLTADQLNENLDSQPTNPLTLPSADELVRLKPTKFLTVDEHTALMAAQRARKAGK